MGSVQAKGPVNIGGEQHVGDVAGGDVIKVGGDVGPGAAVGRGAHVEAQHIAGGDLTVGVGSAALAQLFESLMAQVKQLPEEDQQVAAIRVQQVQAQAQTLQAGDESEETQGRFAQALKKLRAMAPDIGDVAIASLVNPAAGIAMVIKKVAARVQKELEAGKA